MRLYVHMITVGSICTLLYIFVNYILPCELPLRWRRVFLRVNIALYLLPVPWLVAKAGEKLRAYFGKGTVAFPEADLGKVMEPTSVWKSFFVVNREGEILYLTGYQKWWPVIVGGCLIFVALMAGWLAAYFIMSRRYRRMAEFSEDGGYVRSGKRKVRIGTSGAVAVPFTAGIINPVIVLPESISEDRKDSVLRHELCHVADRDILGKFFAFAAVASEWFNPLVYYLFQENIVVSEMLCDMAAVEGRSKEEKTAYIKCILDAAGGTESNKVVTASLRTSKRIIRKRMERIMGKNVRRTWRKGVAAALMAGCFILSSIPALAYEEPWKYETTREEAARDVEAWKTGGNVTLTFYDMVEDKKEYLDFSQEDIVFMEESGTVWGSDGFWMYDSDEEREFYEHTFVMGTMVEHKDNGDVSCTETAYKAQRCLSCGYVIKTTRISTTIYDECPHGLK